MNKEDEETQRWLDEGSYGGGYPVSYRKSPRTTDRIKQEHAELVEALELATYELIAIRARDGNPISYQFGPNGPIKIDLCTPEWWNELTEKCEAILEKVK